MSFPSRRCGAPIHEPFGKCWRALSSGGVTLSCRGMANLRPHVAPSSGCWRGLFPEVFLSSWAREGASLAPKRCSRKTGAAVLGCHWAELHCQMKGGFISEEGQGVTAPFRNSKPSSGIFTLVQRSKGNEQRGKRGCQLFINSVSLIQA